MHFHFNKAYILKIKNFKITMNIKLNYLLLRAQGSKALEHMYISSTSSSQQSSSLHSA